MAKKYYDVIRKSYSGYLSYKISKENAISTAVNKGSNFVVEEENGKKKVLFWGSITYVDRMLIEPLDYFSCILARYEKEEKFALLLHNHKVEAIPFSEVSFIRISAKKVYDILLRMELENEKISHILVDKEAAAKPKATLKLPDYEKPKQFRQ